MNLSFRTPGAVVRTLTPKLWQRSKLTGKASRGGVHRVMLFGLPLFDVHWCFSVENLDER